MGFQEGASFLLGLLFRFHVQFQGCSSSGVIFWVGLLKTELKVQSLPKKTIKVYQQKKKEQCLPEPKKGVNCVKDIW